MSTCHRSSTAAAEHTQIETQPEAAAFRRTPATPGKDQDPPLQISEVRERRNIFYFTVVVCRNAVVEMCGLLLTGSGAELDIAW